MITVLARGTWLAHWGGCNNLSGGVVGALTKIRVRGVVAYVRENLKLDHFVMSSTARLRLKRAEADSKLPGVQVLELNAPAPLWDAIAADVAAADGLKREVRRNRTFTAEGAETLLRGSR